MTESANTVATKEEEIDFYYLKSNFYRVLHVTGAYGGISPQLSIHMNVYGERPPIPRRTSRALNADSSTRETIRDGKHGIAREVEADIVMDVETAKSMVHWLNQQIATVEKILRTVNEEGNNDAKTT